MKLLFDNFQIIAGAPGGVKMLREMILQLAVQGKLVDQDPADEPASLLLEKIKKEKEQLIKDGKIKKQKPLPPITEEEKPFPLPSGWTWTRLGIIANIKMGQSPPGSTYNNSGLGIPLINGPVEFSSGPFGRTIKKQFTTKPTKTCKKDDFLLCVRGSTTGRTNIANFEACIGRGVAAMQSFVFNEFFNWFIVANRDNLYNSGTGSTFKNISSAIISKTVFPLPPLAEQRRIVVRVDSLMALCDKLEQQLARKEHKAQRLAKALTNGITSQIS